MGNNFLIWPVLLVGGFIALLGYAFAVMLG